MASLYPTGPPSTVCMSALRLEAAASALSATVDSGQCTAASIVVTRGNAVVLARGFGDRGFPATSTQPTTDVHADTVFLLASITKPLTACAMLLLVERGLLSLDDPVEKHIPEFVGGDRPSVLVRHLLSHISGLPDMVPMNLELRRAHAPLSEFVADAVTCPLLFPPGTGFSYQSAGVLLAAEIIERISGLPLRDFEQKEIFNPLGMHHSALGLGKMQLESTVRIGVGATAATNQREEEEYGGNSVYWRNQGHPWGGMHSTAEDLSILLRALLNGGSYGGCTVWSPAAVHVMTTNQNEVEVPNAPWGLGWGLRDSPVWTFFGELVSPTTFGHVGATGTVAWADPMSDVTCVILTNEMVEEGALLKRVSNIVAGACDVVGLSNNVGRVEAWSYSRL